MSAAYHGTPEAIGILVDNGAIVDMKDASAVGSVNHCIRFLMGKFTWGGGQLTLSLSFLDYNSYNQRAELYPLRESKVSYFWKACPQATRCSYPWLLHSIIGELSLPLFNILTDIFLELASYYQFPLACIYIFCHACTMERAY